MRHVLLLACALTASAALLAGGSAASAQEYPWCAQYGDDNGGRNCGFSSLAQCETALSGNGGFCERNRFYSAPTGSVAKSSVVKSKKRRHARRS